MAGPEIAAGDEQLAPGAYLDSSNQVSCRYRLLLLARKSPPTDTSRKTASGKKYGSREAGVT